MAALVDQQRLFETPWSRKPLFQLESLVPVVSVHDLEPHLNSMERVGLTSTSLSEKCFQKHPSNSVNSVKDDDSLTVNHGSRYAYSFNKLKANKIHDQASFSSSDDSDMIDTNHTNSIDDEEVEDDDDNLPLSTFLPLKSSDRLTTHNTTTTNLIPNHHQHHYDDDDDDNHSMDNQKNSIPSCPCTKAAVLDDPRLDGLFCSPECLIRSCHEAFDVWLRNHHCIKNNDSII
ncbi:unnamed protein product [Schistosoma turkestanicum]|nr:unnamed protein product [Schistosoma turkestanicum]